MKYNLEQYITNTAGQYVASVVQTFDILDNAKVKYHQLLAAFHNATDVLVAVVKIVDEFGNNLDGFREVVDHTPEPEPEPEPTPEPTPEEPEEPESGDGE
jgi:hypothetical protein